MRLVQMLLARLRRQQPRVEVGTANVDLMVGHTRVRGEITWTATMTDQPGDGPP